jgi:ankyrin repeat protein
MKWFKRLFGSKYDTQLLSAGGKADTAEAEPLPAAAADKNARDDTGGRALCLAAANGNKQVVEHLLLRGADREARTDYAATALHCAAENGHKEVVELLLAKGADKEAKSEFGRTALHEAARCGHKEVVECLLSRGADKEARDAYGGTPLGFAAANGQIETVKLLLANGANEDAKEWDGSTVLHNAALHGQKEVIKLLLGRGADKDAKDKHGRTALHLAAREDHKAVVELLQAHSACGKPKTKPHYPTPPHDTSDFADVVNREYGLTCGSVGWTYQGQGNKTIANQLHDPALCFELTKTFSPTGLCIVAADPTMIVLRTDKGPFCIITSLDAKGTGDFAALVVREYNIKGQPPERKGCMLLQIGGITSGAIGKAASR